MGQGKGEASRVLGGGYEIAQITENDRDILKRLVSMLVLSGSREWSTLR